MRARAAKVALYTASNVCSIAQYGAIGALEGRRTASRSSRRNSRSAATCSTRASRTSPAACSRASRPNGAFYAFVKIDPAWAKSKGLDTGRVALVGGGGAHHQAQPRRLRARARLRSGERRLHPLLHLPRPQGTDRRARVDAHGVRLLDCRPQTSPAVSVAAPAAAPTASGGRILFVDLARAIAVLLMVQGHTIDALLHPDFRTSLQYNAWLYLRGLTSCTFLFLSGAAFSLTGAAPLGGPGPVLAPLVQARAAPGLLPGSRLLREVPDGPLRRPAVRHRRTLAIVLRRGRAAERGHHACSPCRCSSASRARRAASPSPAASLGALLVGFTPLAHGIAWADHLPLIVASYLSFGTGSLFPLFPWAGFTLLGAAFGVTAAPWATRDHLRLLGARALR